MEDEPVNAMRKTTRNLLKISRRFQRNEESDVHRCMENLRLTSTSVAEIANRLKNKSSVSLIELQTLKNGLMDDPKNIEVVLNTHGALRGLVRELSGHDVLKQCAAAGCCCNLAMGDQRAGATVAKAAGPYLVAALDSLSIELAVSCAWALGNLAGSGPTACALLAAQGSVTKLCDLLLGTNEEVRDAAVYALVHFTYQLKDDLRTEFLTKILEPLSKLDITIESSQLIFVVSCHTDFTVNHLTQTLLRKILENITVSIENHLSTCVQTKQCCELVYLLRTLANSIDDSVCTIILNFMSINVKIDSLKKVLDIESSVKESLLWLLGNLFIYCKDDVFFSRLLI